MPYDGPKDKTLPKHIKAMTFHAREVFVSAFNEAYASKRKEGVAHQEAESYAFAVATAAAKKNKGKKTMTEKQMQFDAVVPFFKAETRDGKMFVSMLASSDTVDKAKERVAPEFIAKMKEQAAAGELDLLDSHQDTVPIGKSCGVIDGSAVWDEAQKRGISASGPESLFIPEFEIDPDMPTGVKLFKMLANGKADFQCSVGGKALAKKTFDKESGEVVNELYPGALDHVALTRKGRAANPDCMMFGAIMKSDEWKEVAEPEKEAEKSSEQDVNAAIREALRAKYPPKSEGSNGPVDSTTPWLESFLSFPEAGQIIVERAGKHYKMSYAIVDGKATLGEEVEVTQEWVTAAKADPQKAFAKPDPVQEAVTKLAEATNALNSTLDAVKGQQAAEADPTPTTDHDGSPAVPQESTEDIVRRIMAEERQKETPEQKLEQKPVEEKPAEESKPAEATEPVADPPKEEPKPEESPPEPSAEVEAEKAGAKFSVQTKAQLRSQLEGMKAAMSAIEAMLGDAEPTAAPETPAPETTEAAKDAEIATLKEQLAKQEERLAKLEAQPDGSKMPARGSSAPVEKEFEQNSQTPETMLEKATKLVREAKAIGDPAAIAQAKEHWNKAFTREIIGM